MYIPTLFFIQAYALVYFKRGKYTALTPAGPAKTIPRLYYDNVERYFIQCGRASAASSRGFKGAATQNILSIFERGKIYTVYYAPPDKQNLKLYIFQLFSRATGSCKVSKNSKVI